MSKLKVKLNRAGVAALLKSGEMEGMLRERAETIAKRCGEGYASDTRQMPTRVIASVYTETEAAARDDRENSTILTALRG